MLTEINNLYTSILRDMEKTLRQFETRVPPPQKVAHWDSFVFRYVEKTIHQAMVQKLARIVSGLHVARLLLESGFLQEQGATHRMLDEFHEDILFLTYAVILKDGFTKDHNEYLDAFYQEEYDGPSALESKQKRPMVSRKKIRAYVAQAELAGIDPSTGVELYRTLNKAYSGFVHGASPQIMDMFGGIPPRFHVHGMRGTPRQADHRHDLWNYFFRGIVSFAMVAKAFGDEELFGRIREYHHWFDKETGQNEIPANQ